MCHGRAEEFCDKEQDSLSNKQRGRTFYRQQPADPEDVLLARGPFHDPNAQLQHSLVNEGCSVKIKKC